MSFRSTQYKRVDSSDYEESAGGSSISSSSSSSSNSSMDYSEGSSRSVSGSPAMLPEEEGRGYPVKLNVYDLHPYNKYVYWMGFGAFHAGVEVLFRGNEIYTLNTCFKHTHTRTRTNKRICLVACGALYTEWTFGYGSSDVTGVSINDPKKAPGAVYRETIFLGLCTKTRKEIDIIIERLAREFPGNCYHMLIHNCITFCDTMCFELLGKHIPAWLNRLPHFAYHIKCCLPKMYRGPFPGVEETTSSSKMGRNDGEKSPILGGPPVAAVMKCQNNYTPTHFDDQEQQQQQQQQDKHEHEQEYYNNLQSKKPEVVIILD